MDLSRHCALCNNQEVTLKHGTNCKLTGQKPEFNTTCFKIELGEKLDDTIKNTAIRLENVKRTKSDTIVHVLLFSMASLAVIYGGCYLGEYAWGVGVLSIGPLLIICAGFALLAVAIGPFNKYRFEMAIAKEKKRQLDEVLDLYHLSYDIDLKYEKEIHGIKQIKADLKIKGKR